MYHASNVRRNVPRIVPTICLHWRRARVRSSLGMRSAHVCSLTLSLGTFDAFVHGVISILTRVRIQIVNGKQVKKKFRVRKKNSAEMASSNSGMTDSMSIFWRINEIFNSIAENRGV